MEKNSVVFYKTRFNLMPVEQRDSYDMLWRVVQHIKYWQIRKWNYKGVNLLAADDRTWSLLKYGGKIFTDTNAVFLESEYMETEETGEIDWACRIVEHAELMDGTAPRQWVTDIGFQQKAPDTAEFTCVISYSNRAQFIGPYQPAPSPSVPKLIGRIVGDPTLRCTLGTDDVTFGAKELHVGQWPDFMQRVLDETREIPYVLVSPSFYEAGKDDGEDGGENRMVYLIEPDKLAGMLAGTATVLYSNEPELFTEGQYLNPDYACYDGAVHVYLPSGRHRWIGPDDIGTYGAENVMLFIRRAFAESVNYFDRFFFVEDCRRKRAERKYERRMEELQRRHEEELAASLHRMRSREDAERLALEDDFLKAAYRVEELTQECERLNSIIESNQQQLDFYRESQNGWRGEEKHSDVLDSLPAEAYKPTTNDVISYFKIAYADRIVFTENALRSAKESTVPLDKLWKCLFALATVMVNLYREGSGDIYRQFKNITGIDVGRGEGSQTRKDKKKMDQFEDSWNGEMISIEPHITYPKIQQSIHFGYSQTQKKVVVGHIGSHLDNASTSKIH